MQDSRFIQRTFTSELEIRKSGDNAGRIVSGLAIPFNTPQRIVDRNGEWDETVRNGSFTKTLAQRGDRVKFLMNHDRSASPLGRALLLREDPAGLYGEFLVAKTAAGDEALELIRVGAIDGLSVGVRVLQAKWTKNRSACEWLECDLREISATAFAAYDAAQITGVRSVDLPPTLTQLQMRARVANLKARSYQ